MTGRRAKIEIVLLSSLDMKRSMKYGASLLGVRGDVAKPFTAVWVSHLLAEIFLLMHPALVPVFISEFKLSLFQAGLVVSVPSLTRLAITIPTGILADRFGAKNFIIMSMLRGGFAGIIVSQASSLYFLIAGLSLILISVSMYHPPGMSVIANLFPNETERANATGLHGASGSIGQAIGTISLGVLLVYGWRLSYLLFAIPLLVWAVLLARTRIPGLARQRSDKAKTIRDAFSPESELKHAPRNKSVRVGFFVLLFSMGLGALANSGIAAFMTTYMTSAENFSQEMASVVLGAGPLVGIVGAIVAGRFSSRFGAARSLMLIYFGQVLFLLGLVLLPSTILTTLSFLMYQFFLSAVWTPANSLVVSLMGEMGGGIAYSFFFLSNDAPAAVSPLIAAALIAGLGIVSPFFLAAILLVTCGLLTRFIRR